MPVGPPGLWLMHHGPDLRRGGGGGDSSSSCPGPQRIRNVPSLPVTSSAPTVTRYGSVPGIQFSYEVPLLSISYRMPISSCGAMNSVSMLPAA